MLLLAAIVGTALVVVIALVAVGGVVARLRAEPPRQIFEHEEALEFVAQALPDDVTAELGYEEVRRILRFHLDYLHHKGIARSGGDLQLGPGVRVVDPEEARRYVQEHAALVDYYPTRRHVDEVIAAQLAYFEAIGAVAVVQGPDLDDLAAEQRGLGGAGPSEPARADEPVDRGADPPPRAEGNGERG